MADSNSNNNNTPERSQARPFQASTATQSLRALAQSHLDNIAAEDSAERARQAAGARDLQKYAKVRRRDRTNPAASSQPPLPESKKGTKLRSAQDVLDRLRHDDSLDVADYLVGYLERFEGIKEMPVRAWISESTDEDWIPQHRIKYFKHLDRSRDGGGAATVVWDRERRIDLIFGSGRTSETTTADATSVVATADDDGGRGDRSDGDDDDDDDDDNNNNNNSNREDRMTEMELESEFGGVTVQSTSSSISQNKKKKEEEEEEREGL